MLISFRRYNKFKHKGENTDKYIHGPKSVPLYHLTKKKTKIIEKAMSQINHKNKLTDNVLFEIDSFTTILYMIIYDVCLIIYLSSVYINIRWTYLFDL